MASQDTRPTIYCIGDSHVSFFAGADRIQKDWPTPAEQHLSLFRVFKIGSPLAYSLKEPASQSRGRERLFEVLEKEVPKGSTVLLVFGEIDCRAHVLKQARKRQVDASVIVFGLADRYFAVIEEVAALGFQVVVYNAIPSRRKAPKQSGIDPEYLATGSCAERNEVTRNFNEILSAKCAKAGLLFLSNYHFLVDPRGLTNTWYYFDTIHLSQRAMLPTLKALSELMPSLGLGRIDLPAQAGILARMQDRFLKRIRRLLKLKVPSRIGHGEIYEICPVLMASSFDETL